MARKLTYHDATQSLYILQMMGMLSSAEYSSIEKRIDKKFEKIWFRK